jgi:hypothetical protein
VAKQCIAQWAGTRCQLREDHYSAHAAHELGTLTSWVHPIWGGRIVLDWADAQDCD